MKKMSHMSWFFQEIQKHAVQPMKPDSQTNDSYELVLWVNQKYKHKHNQCSQIWIGFF